MLDYKDIHSVFVIPRIGLCNGTLRLLSVCVFTFILEREECSKY